ncbi:MAG TPA: permease prefix domain 1-containing protein [Terracidiphilus sp.]|nr:permease prefix domain 1-containing protein [Terracidiphilus sp.]
MTPIASARGELDEEIRLHLEEAIAARIATGMNAAEARRLAMIEFGAVERTREECERQRPGWWLGTLLQDMRYALRGFRRNPVFTISARLLPHFSRCVKDVRRQTVKEVFAVDSGTLGSQLKPGPFWGDGFGTIEFRALIRN